MTTGNDERDAMLRRAIGECIACQEPPVIGHVSEKLPADFDLEDDELANALREMKLVPKARQKTASPKPAPAPQPEPQEAELTRQQAQHAMDLAHVRLDNARVAVNVAKQRLGVTKKALADAITAWQQQVDPLTMAERREREMRNHLKAQQEQRAKRGGVHPNATAFVQKRMQNSGNHRGAFPRQFQGRNIRTV